MIEVKNLFKSFDKKEVLKNVSFTLPDKGMIFLIGKSGAGKTTLLNILSTLILDYDGSYYYNGQDVRAMNETEKDAFRNDEISYGFQDDFLFENETVKENLLISFYALGYDNALEAEKIIDDYLTRFEILEKKDSVVNKLSGGERARVSLIRCLIKNTKNIFVDEPTSDVDTETSKIIYEVLLERSKESLVVVISHNQFDAKTYADHILKLENGVLKDEVVNKRINKFMALVKENGSFREIENCDNFNSLVDNLEYDKEFVLKEKKVEISNEQLPILEKKK